MVSILKLFCCLFLSSLWEVLQMGLPEEKREISSPEGGCRLRGGLLLSQVPGGAGSSSGVWT